MSSDLPSDGPSPAAEAGGSGADPSHLRERGAPLLEALESRFPLARDHAESTATYAFAVAVALGLPRATCDLVREAARLHEVGQVYADDAAVLGAGQEETYRLARGAAIGEEPASWLLHARESFDGSGPEGLAGDAIPIESRVIRASCTFHRTTAEPADGSDVPALTRGVQRVRSQAGAELDPEVVAALVTVVERAV